MATTPLITLITPSLNGGAHLRQALESVRQQNDPALEHIIADGGSTDNTAAIVAAFPHARLIQRPDKGSHDAMNMALEDAQGDIISFLNTDDVLATSALADVRDAFARHGEADAIYTSAAFFVEDAAGALRCQHIYQAPEPADLMRSVMFGVTSFNSWYFRRALFTQLGALDAKIDFSADREFLIRVAGRARVAALPKLLYGYRMHARSRTMGGNLKNILAFVREHLQIAEGLLATPGGNAESQRLARQFRAFERAREALYAARLGEGPAAVMTLARHILAHPTWPMDFALAAARRHALNAKLWCPCPPDFDAGTAFPALRV